MRENHHSYHAKRAVMNRQSIVPAAVMGNTQSVGNSREEQR